MKKKSNNMDKNLERKRIGMRIAELRKAKGFTQEELSIRAGLQRTHISRIEAGRYAVTIDTLSAIAEQLGCKVDLIEENPSD